MNQNSIPMKIWAIVYPLLMYYAVTVSVMMLGQIILGNNTASYMLRQIIATVVAIPVMYFNFYRTDQMGMAYAALDTFFKSGRNEGKILNIILIIVISALIGTGLNNIILMTPLAEISTGYAEATENFYGGAIVFEILGSAVLTPVLEELVYRGIIFARLKRYAGFVPAMLIGSLIFAVMHFNLVQFVFAFFVGLVLIVFMEKTAHVYAAVVGHITINTIAVIRTETGFLDNLLDGSALAWGISAGMLLLGILLLCFYVRIPAKADGKTNGQ